jgi:Domain of unknown function (DUF4438), N-terminal/Domain of unknown function (DUF4438), C-terminal
VSALVAVNLLGTVEQAEVGLEPYRVSRDGEPYVPVGDGGIVLGLRLGDSAAAPETDHAAPGASLVHADAAAGHALCAQACVGNPVEVRTGEAAGARGAVLGKRGEGERVLVVLSPEDLARLRPGDAVSVRGCGQGAAPPVPEVTALNAAPGLLEALGVQVGGGVVRVGVRGVWPSRFVGNGIGRPTPLWSLELSVGRPPEPPVLALGDLVAIADLDARFNAGYRRGWMTLGLVVHGGSPLPGHGPGVTVLLTGPAERFDLQAQADGYCGLGEATLLQVARGQA